MMIESPIILCLVRDLLFYSKIRAAAELAGVALRSIRDTEKLLAEIGCGLIVDLNQAGALEAATAWKVATNRPVAGFVSHVDVAIINAAKNASIDRVLARSQFEKNLPSIFTAFRETV